MTVTAECSYPDCGRPRWRRDLCASHYQMQRRGEPLRPIGRRGPAPRYTVCQAPGCERTELVAYGLCYSHYRQRYRGRELTPLRDRRPDHLADSELRDRVLARLETQPNGCQHWLDDRTAPDEQPRIGHRGSDRSLGRFLLEASAGPPPDPRMDAARSCGDRKCVCLDHLSWEARSTVRIAALDAGRDPRTKLDPDAVRTIRTRLADGDRQVEIAATYGVSQQQISAVGARTSWDHVE